jgi:hypothetical protein
MANAVNAPSPSNYVRSCPKTGSPYLLLPLESEDDDYARALAEAEALGLFVDESCDGLPPEERGNTVIVYLVSAVNSRPVKESVRTHAIDLSFPNARVCVCTP